MMKKIISLFLASVYIFTMMAFSAFAQSEEYPFKTSDGQVRDPFVLEYGGKYYLYGTCLGGDGYGCCVSEDLENWSAPKQVFSAYEGFDGVGDYWAPECHEYKGRFYLFATYRSGETQKRGTAIFVSDSPEGPFVLHSDGHITPKHRDCIDGTLYVDENGQPWMFYVNEWTSEPDGIGGMAVVRLSDDLKETAGQAKVIFRGSDTLWASGKITDGPFVYKTSKGRLVMLWSNGTKSGYAVGAAYSLNGRPDGDWLHYPFALYKKNAFNELDGGHPMLIEKDGQLLMLIHSPNASDGEVFETATFIPVRDTGTMIVRDDAENTVQKAFYFVQNILSEIYCFFDRMMSILTL